MLVVLWRERTSHGETAGVVQQQGGSSSLEDSPVVFALHEAAYRADLATVAGKLREQVVEPQPRIVHPVDPKNVPPHLDRLWNERLGQLVEGHDDPWIHRDVAHLVLSRQWGLGVKTVDLGVVIASARLKVKNGQDVPFAYIPQYILNAPKLTSVVYEFFEHETLHQWQMWTHSYPREIFLEEQLGQPGAFKAYLLGNSEMYAYEFQARYATRSGYLARHAVVRALQLGKPELAVEKFLETAHLGVPWMEGYCLQVEQGARDYLRQLQQASGTTTSAAHHLVGGRLFLP